MEFEVSYSLESEQQFWDGESLRFFLLLAPQCFTGLELRFGEDLADRGALGVYTELDDILSVPCDSHALIDNALRSYLHFTSNYREEYLQSEYDIAKCSYRLAESTIFTSHCDYVRRQFVYSFLDEDATNTLHLITSFILFDGRQNERSLVMMNEEGAFPRLLELIQSDRNDDGGLHRRLLELLYEMSRIQRLRSEDLQLIDDTLITYLFKIIEELSDDVNDPYHYPVIRVLLVLNEQYMVLAHDPNPGEQQSGDSLTNRVIKVLSLHGSEYKTFGENIILLLNRESETSLQLLILKLLYLLFTTRSTYEYFYTNDLRVLVDVMIRNLLDLPDDTPSLRHTYLRVLYPLLSHTQLRQPPHYKREEILRLLDMLARSRSAHFAPIDETTIRLVGRCAKVPWLLGGQDGTISPAKRSLGISLGAAAAESSLSVVEVAALKERPGVMTKSRKDEEGAVGSNLDDQSAAVAAVVASEVRGNGIGDTNTQSPFEVAGEA
ncbi:MAG: threonyl-tRNA synthetase [Chaenotheca gracillima]|nr:MAG: threonyl-tRNA synthetase [Chaenotheca gracillima]